MTDTAPTIETDFVFNGFRYAGQLWGAAGAPVLALHGWLDNSASFAVLASHLRGVQLLAPDLAGHGHSDHRKSLCDYPVWSEVAELIAMADSMNWDRFTVVGHSRGAMISMILAATFPERISRLVLIDALTPYPLTAAEAPERMLKSIQEVKRRLQRERSIYPSYEAAIQARCRSDFAKVSQATAETLAKRGLSKMEQGYHWHSDGKLWAPSNIALTVEQIEAFISRITAKVLLLKGKDGLINHVVPGSDYDRLMNSTIDTLAIEEREFDDGHHLHMEAASLDVALAIQEFLGS